MSMSHRIDPTQVRERVTIADALLSAGYDAPTRGRRMRCPVHGGRNPQSFAISPDGRRYRCFGCDAHGDAIDLAQRLLGLDFGAALRHCACLAGIAPSSSAEARRALVEREERRRRRASEEEHHRARFEQALDELRSAQVDADVVSALLRYDPSEHELGTRNLLDELGDPYARELVAHERLDEVEAGCRASRATERESQPVASSPESWEQRILEGVRNALA